MNGYTGKIIRLNLTRRKVSIIDTKEYEQWGGGHGIGSAIFWDIVKDKAINGFDPRNVIIIMTSPLSGTLSPGASGRTEVQGIGVQSSPIEWFTRSNFGGRFGAMLKFAGWDGIVIEGKADKPVWINIINEDVHIMDADNLWGMDTWMTQEKIWQKLGDKKGYGGWVEVGLSKNGGRTTQRPAILTIGPAGENLCRVACLIHDAGNASGQGGFGAVWGSKKLKAISVIGTGSVKIADPNALMEARLWTKKLYAMELDNPDKIKDVNDLNPMFGFQAPSMPTVFWQRPKESRPQACIGCHAGCRLRNESGHGNESSCIDTAFYSSIERRQNSGMIVRAISSILEYFGQHGSAQAFHLLLGKQTPAAYRATDLAQKYGINAYELYRGIPYLRDLNKMGLLGSGKEINCDLPFEKLGSYEFAQKLMQMITFREGIGDDMAEGFYRAAKRWGRLEEDLQSGLLPYSYWGLPDHGYDPRAEVEWGYGSILGDRDINEHDFNWHLYWTPSIAKWAFKDPPISAKDITEIFAEKMKPFENNPMMLDFSTENMYSEHIAKLVAWHRHYTRFWKQSILYCDYRFPDFYNPHSPNKRGLTGEGEQKFFNAVTGKNLSFTEGMEIGRKIWNLDNAIWSLQGRHRDIVHFADYIYNIPFAGKESIAGAGSFTMYYMPGKEDGEWDYISVEGRSLDKSKFEEWKSKFYKLEGWDISTGWPTRKTLKSLGLDFVADELKKKDRLGRG
ncbi:MAG: aldehyde ferredoxin oxidoreductase N-terminal domain-containing protein [Spirochaetota bacterium]|nr:aldehyde ferredoxin oxidoreductase N-terminal domain-containing protein [Spirochaetota bacterium]